MHAATRGSIALALAAALSVAACGGGESAGQGGAPATAAPASGSGGSGLGVGGLGFGGANQGPYADFPETPVVDTTGGPLPPGIVDLFGPAGSGDPMGGPCLLEPPIGALFPKNWVRPKFVWTPAAGENVFELRIKAANEINELVVYTAAAEWTMPKDMWLGLTSNIPDVPMTVTIRGAVLAGGMLTGNPAVGTSGDVRIAPANAAGSIVYWRTVASSDTGELKGYTAGGETVVPALQTPQVQVMPGGNSVTCLGCHTSTPDGKFAAFKTLGSTNGGALASVEAMTTGQAPSYWSGASIAAMNQAEFGVPSFSKAHWASGDYTMVVSWGNGAAAQLAWFDLEAPTSAQGTAYGFLARNGDASGAIMPSFSHDGTSVVYMSTNGSADGRPTNAPSDLYTVPFAAKMGGAATPIAGAAEAAFSEYYPALSPDDRLVAFNRVGSGTNTYDELSAELFVIPSGGGMATRLDANDPVACSGLTSPGVTNSWPKWAPEAVVVGDRTFYWIAFSSKRTGAVPQLFVAAVVDHAGALETHPAIHIWPQPADEANHTPAWDVFQIPMPQPN